MSIEVDVKRLTESEANKIVKDLRVKSVAKPSVNKRFQKGVVIEPYHVTEDEEGNGDMAYLPYNYTLMSLEKYPRDVSNYPKSKLKFTGTLSDVQKGARKETFELLNVQNTCIISFQCGLGKTIFSLYLISKLGLKAMVLLHRITLISQWEHAIQQFLPSARVQVCGAGNPPSKKADIYIMNMINVPKLDSSHYADIGTLVVDEVHVACAEQMSKSLIPIFPFYSIGLSATPDRKDGLDKLLDLYFGPQRIIRKVERPHTVYQLQTGFVPEVSTNKQGDLDWNSLIKSQSEYEPRNKLIVDILCHFRKRTWLVLCKRVNQAKWLHKSLQDLDQDATLLIRSDTYYDTSSRIVISTYSKTGVGFNHPSLDALLLASDVDDGIEQVHGRVFRRDDVEPIIVDLVDDFPSLKRHWQNRRRFYKQHHGNIKIFKEEFPDFSYSI